LPDCLVLVAPEDLTAGAAIGNRLTGVCPTMVLPLAVHVVRSIGVPVTAFVATDLATADDAAELISQTTTCG
jgi:hypothetical protein